MANVFGMRLSALLRDRLHPCLSALPGLAIIPVAERHDPFQRLTHAQIQ